MYSKDLLSKLSHVEIIFRQFSLSAAKASLAPCPQTWHLLASTVHVTSSTEINQKRRNFIKFSLLHLLLLHKFHFIAAFFTFENILQGNVKIQGRRNKNYNIWLELKIMRYKFWMWRVAKIYVHLFSCRKGS